MRLRALPVMGVGFALALACSGAEPRRSYPLGEPVMVDREHPIDRLDWMRGTWRASPANEPGFLVRLWRNGFELERRVAEDSIGARWQPGGTFSSTAAGLVYSYVLGDSYVIRNSQGDSIGEGTTDAFFHNLETQHQDGRVRFEETQIPEPGWWFEYRRTSDSTMVYTSDDGEYTLTRIDD